MESLWLKFKEVPNAGIVKFIPSKVVREYDQEIPQSQTANNPMASRGRVTQPSRDTRKSN